MLLKQSRELGRHLKNTAAFLSFRGAIRNGRAFFLPGLIGLAVVVRALGPGALYPKKRDWEGRRAAASKDAGECTRLACWRRRPRLRALSLHCRNAFRPSGQRRAGARTGARGRFGEPPKPAREPRALPSRIRKTCTPAVRSRHGCHHKNISCVRQRSDRHPHASCDAILKADLG